MESGCHVKAKKVANDVAMTINCILDILHQLRDNFLNACAKWVVEDFQPFNVRESKSFKAMIKALNPKLNPPDAKTLRRKLHLTKATASANMKTFLKGKYFSVTIDHWTSIANQNYAALTLHTIENSVIKSLTLSCLKHKGGSIASELDDQLSDDLDLWGLSADKFIAIIKDAASNMTKLGRLVEEKCPNTVPHYCADHNLTTQKAYSGDIAIRLGGIANSEENEEGDIVKTLKKA